MAPEVARRIEYNEKVDIYSLAIVMYEMLTGMTPFGGLKAKDFFEKVVDKAMRPPYPKDCVGRKIVADKEFFTLMASCWDVDPTRRPDARSVLNTLTELAHNYHYMQSTSGNLCCPLFSRR
jgi:serine/threonine protein kinase